MSLHPMSLRPLSFLRWLACLAALSLLVEGGVLSNTLLLSARPYHAWHVALTLGLAGAIFSLRAQARSSQARAQVLALACGMATTGLGDWVNSAISGITPVSAKLQIALLLFGLGYGLDVWVLAQQARDAMARAAPGWLPWRHAVTALVALNNGLGWWLAVRPLLLGLPLLCLGSAAFNLSVYVAMPTLAIWLMLARRGALDSVMVLLGALLLQLSDLVLLRSWLAHGDAQAVSQQLYAANWVLYYSGQALMASLAVWPLREASHQASCARASAGRPMAS